MKQKLKTLDGAMDYLTALAMHCTKAMVEHSGDDDMLQSIGKIHSSIQKMSANIKDYRTKLDPHGMYESRPESFYKFSEVDTTALVALSDEIKTITGREVIDEQVMVLKAHKDSLEKIEILKEENAVLHKEIVSLKEKAQKVEKVELVNQAIKEIFDRDWETISL